MESNVILTELQKNSGVFRFDSLSKCESKSVSQNNILISKTKLPGKVITVESYNRIRNNFHFEEQSLHTENEHNAAIKHLKLSKRDRITVLSNENKILHQTENGIQSVYKITTPDDLGLTSEPLPSNKLKTKKVRTKKDKTKCPIPKEEVPNSKIVKTRSGRLILKSQNLETNSKEEPQTFRELINDLRDTEFKCSIKPKEEDNFEKNLPRKRKLSPDSKCPTCGKVFLGKRMLKHFLTHPDHQKVLNENNHLDKLDLYSFLVDKVKHSPENIRTEVFLNELSNFITKLQNLSSRLIQNTTGMHFINQNLSKVLSIPEGCYSLDISALYNNSNANFLEPELPEYNSLSNISLNLSSDNIIPQSEESLLKTVDDLVKEGIKKLNSFDHHAITDNAVEAEVIMKASKSVTSAEEETTSTLPPAPPSLMDLSLDVDMFQFKSPLKDLSSNLT